MFARIVTVELGSGMREEGIALAERWFAAVATLPGFVDVTFFLDDDRGVFGYFSQWETREDALAVPDQIGPQVREAAEGIGARKPTIRVFEVYRPREMTD